MQRERAAAVSLLRVITPRRRPSMTATTRHFDPTALRDTLYLSLELGEDGWTLSFTSGFGKPVLRRRIRSRDRDALRREIDAMKERMGLARDCRVVSCYEAGREG